MELGAKFRNYNEFKAVLEDYSRKNFVQFYMRCSSKLESISKRLKKARRANKELVYYHIKMCCIYGGKEFKKKPGCQYLRQTKTFRQYCPAYIYCSVSKCGQFLIISSMELIHNHPVSEQVFKQLPQQRRLPKAVRERVALLLKMKVDKKSLRENIRQNMGIVLSSKDLSNILRNYKCSSKQSCTPDQFWTKELDACLPLEVPKTRNFIQSSVTQNSIQSPVIRNSIQSSITPNSIQSAVIQNSIQSSVTPNSIKSSIEQNFFKTSVEQNMLSSYNEKFQQISAITQKINEVVSHCSGKEFEQNKNLLEDILKIFKASTNGGLRVADETSNNSGETSDSQQDTEKAIVPNCTQGQFKNKVQSLHNVQLLQSIDRTETGHVLHKPYGVNSMGNPRRPEGAMRKRKIIVLTIK